jgi:hypothetical protein
MTILNNSCISEGQEKYLWELSVTLKITGTILRGENERSDSVWLHVLSSLQPSWDCSMHKRTSVRIDGDSLGSVYILYTKKFLQTGYQIVFNRL